MSNELMLLPFYQENMPEAGCDEAGRGCLAGPVFAAAVVLEPDFHHPLLNDSKTLSEADRYSLRTVIEKEAVCYAVGQVSHQEIDEMNILNASFLAMHRALDQLSIAPAYILVDGNRFKKYREIPHSCMVKGDSSYFSIAAASILAKTYRDDFMQTLSSEYPEYHWNSNKGYPTIRHREAIVRHGFSPWHRRTFRVMDPQLRLLFENLE